MLNWNSIWVAVILSFVFLNSCSIMIIRNENERREKVAQDHIGWSQEELERFWGSPVATVNHGDGSKTCIYEFKRLGQLPNEEKQFIVADIIFLGTAEIAFVPATIGFIYTENAKAPKTRGLVTYSIENKVTLERCVQIE